MDAPSPHICIWTLWNVRRIIYLDIWLPLRGSNTRHCKLLGSKEKSGRQIKSDWVRCKVSSSEAEPSDEEPDVWLSNSLSPSSSLSIKFSSNFLHNCTGWFFWENFFSSHRINVSTSLWPLKNTSIPPTNY